MSIQKISLLAIVVVAACSTIGTAQDNGAVVTAPINNWSYYRHASTATEGYLRGSAAVITAAGQKNYLDSIAAINLQEAYRRGLENRKGYVRTYFEVKEINRQYREKYAPVPPTEEQWARITQAWLPDRLTAAQYDPATGRLVWPHILRTDSYKAFRDRIDQLVASRTPDNSGDGSQMQRELHELIDAMKMLLKSNIDQVSASQYGAAKTFLLSLDYEAQQPLNNVPVSAPAPGHQADHQINS